MSHLLSYAGHYFRIEIADVVAADEPGKTEFIAWASDAFKEMKDMPSHVCSRLVPGAPLAKREEALRRAYDWVKSDWDSQQTKRVVKPRDRASVVYTVWLFQNGNTLECQFAEFADAKTFAKAAEKILDIKKVGITNNESPQYLTLWERAAG